MIKFFESYKQDKYYIKSVPGWIGKGCHGKNEMEVYRQLCIILDEWIEIFKKEKRILPLPTNKKYSGKFVLRTGSELHKALVIKALNEGESLNMYLVKKLKTIILD